MIGHCDFFCELVRKENHNDQSSMARRDICINPKGWILVFVGKTIRSIKMYQSTLNFAEYQNFLRKVLVRERKSVNFVSLFNNHHKMVI